LNGHEIFIPYLTGQIVLEGISGYVMLISVCMFCKTAYGIKPGRGVSGVSHGVCPACEPFALEWLEKGVGVEKSERICLCAGQLKRGYGNFP
jgi:hypothetical protein